MKSFGPIRGWWTLPAERAIAVVKRKLTHGNYHNYYKRVYSKEFNDEYRSANERFSSKSKLFKGARIHINTISFSDFRNELINYEGDYVLSPYQVEEYVKFMLTELEKITDANAELYSPLLRVYSYFIRYRTSNVFQLGEKTQKFRKTEFADKFLPWLLNNSENVQFLADDEANPNSGTVEQASWTLLLDSKMIFKKDFLHLKRIYSKNYKVPYYKSALVWGVNFRARGIDFLELDQPILRGNYGQQDKENIPSNNRNDWKNTTVIFDNLVASSLCIVRKHGHNETNILHFCQINYFSRINEPMETLIHGKMFCHVVTRDCSELALKVNSKTVNYENLYKSDLNFVTSLTLVDIKDIYPCPLAITPCDNYGEPITVNKKRTINNVKAESLLIMLLERNRQSIIDKQEINSLYK